MRLPVDLVDERSGTGDHTPHYPRHFCTKILPTMMPHSNRLTWVSLTGNTNAKDV